MNILYTSLQYYLSWTLWPNTIVVHYTTKFLNNNVSVDDSKNSPLPSIRMWSYGGESDHYLYTYLVRLFGPRLWSVLMEAEVACILYTHVYNNIILYIIHYLSYIIVYCITLENGGKTLINTLPPLREQRQKMLQQL